MEQKYILLGIDIEATHSKYGPVYIAHANPAVQGYGRRCFYSTTESSETDYFVFKRDIQIKNKLDAIGRSGDVWSPVAEDFQTERSSNRQRQVRTLFLHKSLFSNTSIKESTRPGTIPNDKLFEPLKQYRSSSQSQSFQEYVSGKVVDDEYAPEKWKFLAWLFDDNSLQGKGLTTLPSNYFYEVQRFVFSCQNYR